MKICILGDTHFGARNDSPHFSKFFRRFYEEVFFPYLEQNEIKHIIQLGDVFDRRKYINFASLKESQHYFFNKLRKYNTTFLAGNHDVFYKNTNELNSLDLLIGGSTIRTIVTTQPQEITIGGVDILVVPWITQDNYEATMQAVEQTRAQIMVGHLELAGFEMYRGQVIDSGMDAKLFDKFDIVMSGHYHHRSTARNITYVGTPYQMTWSDYDDRKGFHVFDTDTRELEFIPNPFDMFYKIHYDDINQTIDYPASFDLSQMAGAFVKLIIRNKVQPVWFDALVDRLEKLGVADLQVVEDHFHLDLESDDDIVNQAEDTLTILKKYVEQMDATVDKQSLEALLRSLYSEALSIE